MRETVTISLPQTVRRELDKVAKEEGVSRSDVLRQSLEDFLFVRRFRQLRQRMMAAAQAQGIFTDEDVFNRVSSNSCWIRTCWSRHLSRAAFAAICSSTASASTKSFLPD